MGLLRLETPVFGSPVVGVLRLAAVGLRIPPMFVELEHFLTEASAEWESEDCHCGVIKGCVRLRRCARARQEPRSGRSSLQRGTVGSRVRRGPELLHQ